MKKAQRLFQALALVFFVVLALPGSVRAQGTTDEIGEFSEAVNIGNESGQPSLPFLTDNQVDSLQSKIVCSALGGESCPNDPATGQAQVGAVGSIAGLMGDMYSHPPATGTRFVADLLETTHIVPQAYAQGLGFSALEPVQTTWKAMRNVSYLFLVIVFLAIGFMIMFRKKIGQTAVTAQQSIPSIIVTLLAITFSYAIAGVLIEVMYLIMSLFVGLFTLSDPTVRPIDMDIFSLGKFLLSSGTGAAFQAVDEFVTASLNVGANNVLSFLSGLTVAVIMAVAILIGIFRLFFELLKTYVSIVLLVAFSPLILLRNAFPGGNAFGAWIGNLFGNLSAYVAVLISVIAFDQFVKGPSASNIQSGGFMPPFMLNQGAISVLPTMLGIGLIIILPEIVVQAKKALGAKDGIFTQLAADMGKSFKRGYTGEGLRGIGGKKILTTGAGIAASGATAGIGGTIGAAYGARRGGLRGALRGGLTGAVAGGATPYVTTKVVPGALRSAWREGKSQVGNVVANEALDMGLDKVSKMGGIGAEVARRAHVSRKKKPPTTPPTYSDPPATNTSGDSY